MPYVYRVDLGRASKVDRSTLPLGMPQMRHAPGPVSTTSGSIGQIHSAARLGAGGAAGAGAEGVIAEARGPAFNQ